MKKLAILLVIAVLASVYAISVLAAVDYADRLILEVPNTAVAPVIDGTKDDCYTNSFSLDKPGPATVDSTLTTGVISFTYNGNVLYGFLEVTGDTTPMEVNAYPYENDNFEQYFDLDCSMPEAMGDNQYRFRIMPATETLNTDDYSAATSYDLDIDYIVKWNDTGYIIEFAYTLPVSITADMEIGYDADLTDDREGNGVRNTQVFLGSAADDQWRGASNFGCVMKFNAPAVVETPVETPVETLPETPVETVSAVTTAPQTSDAIVLITILISISAAAIITVKSVKVR